MKFFKKNILNFLILTLGFFIILLTLWITKTFGKNVYYVEILYNIHIGYEGFKDYLMNIRLASYYIQSFLLLFYQLFFYLLAIN